MRKLIYTLAGIISTLVIMSCSNEFKVNNITVYPENITLACGDSMRINAVIDFSGGKYNEPDLIKLHWTSDNHNVVTVDSTGFIRTHSTGTAGVSVNCENVSATCTVTVTDSIPSNAEGIFSKNIKS